MICKSRSGVLFAGVGVLAVILPAGAGAQEISAQDKLLAKRAAEADCYRKLAETVYGVKITSATYVRDFVTESDEIRSGVDTFVKGIRFGPARYYDDGTCEIDAEVTVAKLVTTLKAIHTAHYQGNRIETTDFENIKQTLKKNVIRVTGAGVPRPDVPDLPEGLEDALTPLPGGSVATRFIPEIWRALPGQARLMAERAAKHDAWRKLLERVKGVRLTSDTLVRDFVTEYDEIASQVNGIVVGASEVSTYLHHDELIAEVTLELPLEKIVTKLKELHTTHYKGNRVTTTDIVNIKKTVKRKTIRATGCGVPPARFVRYAKGAGAVTPNWMTRQITATGQATDKAIDTAQGKLRAARAAELDAMRKLAEQVYGLSLSSNTTVRDFVTEHDEIVTQVDAVVSNAIAGIPSFEGDVATITVTIPAAEVWSVVHQQMLIIERRG